MMKRTVLLSILFLSISLAGCSAKDESDKQPPEYTGTDQEIPDDSEVNNMESTETAGNSEAEAGDLTEAENQTEAEPVAPTKEEVLAMRELVLEGMSEEEISRLKENIKIANLQMERAYLYDDIFAKLDDPESLYWNYFDEKGEIQISETETVYNRFNAENFINLLEDTQSSVQNEKLWNDLQQIIDQTELAAETHEMEYANNIYKLLHDMDYYLLRYGPEDVGIYTQDRSTISKYYGVLTVYAD